VVTGRLPGEAAEVVAARAEELHAPLAVLGRDFQVETCGEPTLLDECGARNPGEFFAVATTFFFTRPRALEDRHPSLYAALRAWYRRDPAARPEPAGLREGPDAPTALTAPRS
jgi:Mlc titration factor MtfA (ptsG expression regulator)